MKLIEVTFKSDKLLVVQDGKEWVAVSTICKNLGIDDKTQIKKIKSDPAFEAKYIEVQTKGGLQKVFCIPLEKLNGWLFTINPNKVKPEVKQKLIAYKNECFKVLYEHFIQKAIPANCLTADNMSTRISGYKGQLARRKKEIERLRFELALCKEELKKCQAEHNDANLWREEAKIQKERADKNQELMEHFRQMAGFQVYKIGVIYDAVDELKEIRSELTDTPKAYHIVSKVMNILNTHIKKADEYVRFLQIPPLVKKINSRL